MARTQQHNASASIIPDMSMHELHSTDFGIDDDDQVLDMMTPNAEALLAQLQSDPISEREFKDIAEYEQFMNDPIVVLIHEDKDPNAMPMVPLGINGDRRWLPRNVRLKLPRKFVEVLCQSQETHFKTEKNPDASSDQELVTRPKTAQCYGFSVVKDPDPRGPHWLRRVMAQNRRRG